MERNCYEGMCVLLGDVNGCIDMTYLETNCHTLREWVVGGEQLL